MKRQTHPRTRTSLVISSPRRGEDKGAGKAPFSTLTPTLSLAGRGSSWKPAVIWFTGLSGSGKSTIATKVHRALKKCGVRAEYLDGDGLRAMFPATGFTKAERDMHIRRAGHLASLLEKNGVFVVASFVSPYAKTRRFVRTLCRNFVEVHVSTPLEVCEQRDVKGLYAKARRGEIRNFTGVDDPYEPPAAPEIDLNTAQLSEREAFSKVMDFIRRRYLNGVK